MVMKQSYLQKIRQKTRDHSGMTLIEVIVSFAILGVISVILLQGVSTGLSVINEAQKNNESTNAYSSGLDWYDETAETLTNMPGVSIDNTETKTLTITSTEADVNGIMLSGQLLSASLDESEKDQYTYNADMQMMAFLPTGLTLQPTLPDPPLVEAATTSLWAPYVFTKEKDETQYGADTALGLDFEAFQATTGDIDGTVNRGISDDLISITNTTTTSYSTATQLFINAGIAIETSTDRLYQSNFYALSGTYTETDDQKIVLAPKDVTDTTGIIDDPDYLLIYIADGTTIQNSSGTQITFSKSFTVGDGQNDNQFSDNKSSEQALPSGYYWIAIPTSLSKNDDSGIIDYGNGTYGINLFDLCPEANASGKIYKPTDLYQAFNTSVSNDSKDTGYYLDIGLLDTDATVTSLTEDQKKDLEILRAALQDRDVKIQTVEEATTYVEPENLPEVTAYTTSDDE